MSNWTQAQFPVAPWDPPGLPPRRMNERCARHKHCAYRDDDPARCPICHMAIDRCAGEHGSPPSDGGWRRNTMASVQNSALKAGQYIHPTDEAKHRSTSNLGRQ